MAPRMARTRFVAGTAAAALSARFRGPQHDRYRDPQHRSIIVIDLAGFGTRTDLLQLRARADLDAVVHAALRASGVPRSQLLFENRGDGMIIFLPATVSKAVLLQPFVPALSARLRVHNQAVRADHRIRLRVAVHAGEVVHGPHGWIGTDLNLACRLVDSALLREELVRRPRADLAVVISDVIHQAVVRHGHRGTDAFSYREVRVAVKEVATRAWIHTPGENIRSLLRQHQASA
jgi:hypothetical protein